MSAKDECPLRESSLCLYNPVDCNIRRHLWSNVLDVLFVTTKFLTFFALFVFIYPQFLIYMWRIIKKARNHRALSSIHSPIHFSLFVASVIHFRILDRSERGKHFSRREEKFHISMRPCNVQFILKSSLL